MISSIGSRNRFRKGTLMTYKQIYNKMPEALRRQYSSQEWAVPYLKEGREFHDVLACQADMQELLTRMSEMESRLLEIIVRKLGWTMFTWEMLDKHTNDYYSGAEVKVGLDRLRGYGIICTFRKSWGELLYVLPRDGFHLWQSLLSSSLNISFFQKESCLEKSVRPEGLESLEPCPVDSRGMAQQLFLLLWYADNYELTLTAKGTLHKKRLQKLAEIISLPNEPWSGIATHYTFSEHYEVGFALLLDVSMRLGLIRSEASMLSLDKLALHNWLDLSFEQQQLRLYTLWKELFVLVPVWMQHSITLMEKMVAIDQEWSSVEQILHFLRDQHIPLDALGVKELKALLLERWLIPLHSSRWIELAVDGAGGHWFRWLLNVGPFTEEDDSPSSGSFYVQPDFELLLPPDVAPRIEWEAAAFAEPRSADLLRVYRITKESFHKALEKGYSGDNIAQLLQSHSIHQVPQSLMLTLQEWSKQYGKLTFCEVTLLRCVSVEMAEAIKNSTACQSYVEANLGEKDFLVKKDQAEAFRKQLEQMGYSPQILLQNEANHLPARSKDSEPREGLFQVQDPLQLYELEPNFPLLTDMYPHMQEIPPLWLKEYRGYHASTGKDMIRKAIEWQCYLRLRKEGVDRKVVPKDLREDRNGWCLIGLEEYREVSLASEDWGEMKLILPGVNDH
jgi:hypothetical protein